MDTIRWGIIGCGAVTEVKSGPGLQKAKGSELVAVMRRNGEKAADYARRHKVPRWYDDADALIADPEVDAVYIATPPDSHMQYVLKVAEAGKPVYCEKPLGRNLGESSKMVAFCKERDIPLFCAYYRRAMPKYLQVEQLLSRQAIGEIRFVDLLMYQTIKEDDRNPSWRVQPEISGGGRFLDVGSHALDLLDWLLGPIAKASGIASNQSKTNSADDIVSGSWIHETGIHGTGTWCFNAFKDEDTVTLFGSEGRLTFSVLDVAAPIVLETANGYRTIEVPDPPAHVAQPLIQTVTDQLRGIGTCPSTGETALRTDRAMEWLQGK
jgi:predicted dehydrogenase